MSGKINAGVIIPAAGLSSRFGGEPKALANFEGRSLLSRAADAFRLCGLENIIVVTGHRREEVEQEADRLGLKTVFNPGYQEGMFSSVKTGLRALETGDAFFILPVDGALVKSATILGLLSAWQRAESKKKKELIIIPAFGSQAGHPPLIHAGHKPAILDWAGPAGLKGWLASNLNQGSEAFLKDNFVPDEPGANVKFVRLKDEGIVCDIDTPADLATAEIKPGDELPSISEAWQLLLQSPLSPTKIRHHLRVASSALRLTLALKTIGENQADPKLSLLSGLLHDLDRNQPNHALAARRHFEALGWPDLALVAGAHTDPPAVFLRGLAVGLGTADRPEDSAYTEADRRVRLSSLAVYLADKYWWDDEAVTIKQRADITRRHKLGDEAETADSARRDTAQAIDQRESIALGVEYWFRRVLGKDPEALARERSGDDGESDLEILYNHSFGRKKKF